MDRELWEKTQRQLRDHAAHRREKPAHTLPSPLAGKLFDEDGAPLYVCGTTKGERRYRYYVSRKLIRDSATKAEDGWRLAAPEIERSVVIAARQILKDQVAISTVLFAVLDRQPESAKSDRLAHSRGTERVRNGEKFRWSRPNGRYLALSGPVCSVEPPHIRGISRISPQNIRNRGLVGGEGGIRTLGTGYPVRQISNPTRRFYGRERLRLRRNKLLVGQGLRAGFAVRLDNALSPPAKRT